MRYAIFGDIHGNLEALEVVLEKLAREKPDRYICIGDIIGYGADPTACMEKIKSLDCIRVAGNHDWAAAGLIDPDFFSSTARTAINWTITRLSGQDREILRQTKLIERIDHITISHANFYQPELFEYIQTNHELQAGFKYLETSLGVIGHSHIPIAYQLTRQPISRIIEPLIEIKPHSKTIVNVGSVGQPRDEDPRATYAIYDTIEGLLELKRVNYNVEKAGRKIIAAGLPQVLAERLKYGA